MSRWHLTPSRNAHEQAESICIRAGLNTSGVISQTGYHIQAYYKRAVNTPNFVECGEADWICSAGTIIFKSQLGRKALLDFYSDFVNSGIEAVRSRAIGHYAVAVKCGNEVTVFTDPQGALSLYYVNSGSLWFVSNSLHVCAYVLPIRRIDPIKLAITAIEGYTPGEETFYSGILRLFGTQVIHIDINNGAFRVDNIPSTDFAGAHDYSRYTSISDALDRYKSEVRTVFRELKEFAPIGLLGTGGLDSRTVLAALLDQQATPQIMYGAGNNGLTDDRPHDLKVAKDIAKMFNLPFQQLDWSGEQPHSQNTMKELFKTYGFQYEIYGSPQSYLRGFSGSISPYPKLFLGGLGPVFTNKKPWQLTKTQFSFEDLIEYAISSNVNGPDFICRDAYKSDFSQEVRTGLRRGMIDFPDHGASLKAFVRAFLFLYLRPDSRLPNFVNEFCHYVSPFLMKRLHDPLVDIPFEYRANDEFQVRLIHELVPDLLNIPLVSDHRRARIDRSTFTMKYLEPAESESKERTTLGRLADLILPRSRIDRTRQFYHRMKQGKKRYDASKQRQDRTLQIIQAYEQLVMHDPFAMQWLSSYSNLTLKEQARLAHYLVGVNTLGYSK